jgi:hypothetical protein
METMIMLRVIDIASRQVRHAAKTHKAVTRRWRARGLMKLVNFAKGVLIGGIMVISAWLLLG